MKRFFSFILVVLILLIPILLTIGWFFNHLTKKSFYPEEGVFRFSGLKTSVKIYSDIYGVPHIITDSDESAYFTLGYLHARDRLWQMDLSRRVAEGKLSEIFGTKTIEFDILFRTIGINRFAFSWYKQLNPFSKMILDSYAKGVNSFISEHKNNLPVEFDALNYYPDEWKPEHSLMIARLMGWELNIAWFTDYIFAKIISKVGYEKTSEIFPDSSIVIFQNISEPETDTVSNQNDISFESLNDFLDINKKYKRFFGLNSFPSGSNCWVVSGEKTFSGKPLLANDPHLSFSVPSKWYEAHIKSSNLDVFGMTLPGVPGIVIGQNKKIAWCMTNLMNDDNDMITLRRDSTDKRRYLFNNKSYSFDSLTERIQVKDSLETTHSVLLTSFGPVISDLKTRGFADNKTDTTFTDDIITFRWTGFEYTDDINTFYQLNRASNWNDFKSALKNFCVPAQNFIYADIEGNIAYHTAGKIPIRKNSNLSTIISPAEESEWTGFVEFEKLPSIVNPENGFIATANTNPFNWLSTDKQNRFYISYFFEPDSRFEVIYDFLNSKSKFDTDDFRLLQMSDKSNYALTIKKYLLESFQNYNNADKTVSTALSLFNDWDGELSSITSHAAILNTFLSYLIFNIYSDELGEKLFDDFLIVQNIPYRSLLKILSSEKSAWFDNINTSETETCEQIIRLSFQQAIELLKNIFGNEDIYSWNWGQLHQIKFKHPLGSVELLDKSFNIGPFEIGGDQTSVNNTSFSFNSFYHNKKFDVKIGASMRFIADMSDIEHPRTVITTGQNGQPLHSNYKDQTRLWLYGGYKIISLDEENMIIEKYKLLELHPQ